MNVYRIAHPLVLDPDTSRAVGPYNAGRVARERALPFAESLVEIADIIMENNSDSHTPPPMFEGLWLRAGREQSVFASPEQATEWFRVGMGAMREAGFRWFTYEIPEKEVRTSYTQAVANLRRARLVSITDLPFEDGPEPQRACGWCLEIDCRCEEETCHWCYNYMSSCDCADNDSCGNIDCPIC